MCAERMVTKWELLGFRSISHYIFHVREERREEEVRELLAQQRALPLYVQFGYATDAEYRDATKSALESRDV